MQKVNQFVVCGSTAYLFCPIPRNRAFVSVAVDTADLIPLLNLGYWRVADFCQISHKAYAYTVRPKSRTDHVIYMHRHLANPPVGMLTDHINRRGTDNRRSNLRAATPKQNQQNRRDSRRSAVKGA